MLRIQRVRGVWLLSDSVPAAFVAYSMHGFEWEVVLRTHVRLNRKNDENSPRG